MFNKFFSNLLSIFCKYRFADSTYINIASDSKVNFSRIKQQERCLLHIATGTIIEARLTFECDDSKISIGKNTFIGAAHLVCSKSIIIGNNVLIAWGCTVVDHDSHALQFSLRKDDVTDWFQGEKDWSNVKRKAVSIKDKVWIGFNSIILKGVTIGEGSIVGAGSVVTKDIPPWSIVAGNPAKIIREIPEHER